MSDELQNMAPEIAELRLLRDQVRTWSNTADRLLILEDQALPVSVRKLLTEIAGVAV